MTELQNLINADYCATLNMSVNMPVSYNFGDVFIVRPNGAIEFGPNFTTIDEASLKFWDSMIKLGWNNKTEPT